MSRGTGAVGAELSGRFLGSVSLGKEVVSSPSRPSPSRRQEGDLADTEDRYWNCGVVPKRWFDGTYPGLDEQRLLCSNCFARTTRQPVYYGWAKSSADWGDDGPDEMPQAAVEPAADRASRRTAREHRDSRFVSPGRRFFTRRRPTYSEIPERRSPTRPAVWKVARLRHRWATWSARCMYSSVNAG
jgi:hypothetical protein